MGKVGLHHPYLPNVLASNPAAIEVQTQGRQSMTAYMEKMGVKAEIVDAMYSIKDPERIRYLDAEELRAYKLSTNNWTLKQKCKQQWSIIRKADLNTSLNAMET